MPPHEGVDCTGNLWNCTEMLVPQPLNAKVGMSHPSLIVEVLLKFGRKEDLAEKNGGTVG